MKIKEAQEILKDFANKNGWEDLPNIDKIDHLHEELVEVSQYLRYKNQEERIQFVRENKEMLTGEMGDVLFGLCRLANQLGIDLEDGFKMTKDKAFAKYDGNNKNENNIVNKDSLGNNNDN